MIPLVVAGVTAVIATRNAKKTPHERLKNLVDIHKNMPDSLDGRKVVEGAIARELVDFDRRLAADQRGFWAGIKERLAQIQRQKAALVAAGVIGVALPTVLFVFAGWGSKVGLWASALAGLGTVLGAIGAMFAVQEERKSLNVDRAAAEISAHFSRAYIQALSLLGKLDLHETTYASSVFGRLIDMGVFERADIKGPNGELSIRLVLTPEGRKALDSALAQAEVQNAAKWADVAKENGAEGDDGPGREEPGGVAPG